MKKPFLLISIVIALLLSACGPQTTATPIPTLVLDAGNNSPSANGNEITASVVVVPITHVDLSFAGVGRVTEVNVQAGDEVTEGDVLVQIDTSILEANVREAEANLAAAQAQLRYLKRIGTNEPHLETAEADVDRAQALLDLANATLESRSMLTAPFSGIVIEVNIHPFETVVPGQVVVVVADLTQFKLETTDLSEKDIAQIKNGQKVRVSLEAFSDDFEAQVVDIDRVGQTLGGDVVYTVIMLFDTQPEGLRWGMSGDANINVGK